MASNKINEEYVRKGYLKAYLANRGIQCSSYEEWERLCSCIDDSKSIEIIRCKDCKYWHKEIHNGIEYFNFSSCDLNHGGDGNNFYCADAERRDE